MMKKKLTSKKCIALVMAAVMVITSVPLMMVSALTYGSYDPAPYWGDGSEYSAINTNFIATLNTDGSVSISFPDAVAQKTYDGSSTKTIEKYMFVLTKLCDDGTREEIWSDVFEARNYTNTNSGGVFTITAGIEYPNNIYYAPGGLVGLAGYDAAAKYDCAIMAIDSDGWFSDKIHTLLSDVPYYEINADFSPVETWVAREMLLFEGAGSQKVKEGSQSSSGDTSGSDYQIYTGSAVDINGYMAGTGNENSAGYRFWFNSAYDGTSFGATTMWSRSHYNFENAEEVWFYVDFSRVDISQVAFSLTANEKEVTSWRSGEDATDYYSRYGTVFSTKAVNGVNTGKQAGVYIQNADGLWEETAMTDGYLTELSGYEGYVRIPVEYFVLQENQYITADNIREFEWTQTGSGIFGSKFTTADDLTNYKNQHLFLESNGNTVSIDGVACSYTTETMTFVYDDSTEDLMVRKFLVNEAGTPVTESMIVYERYEKATTKTEWTDLGSTSNRGLGWTLHFDPTGTGTTSMTKNGTAYNIDSSAATKAIEDLVSAGIEVAGWSDDSVSKSFYIDQVMFCQKADGATFNDDGSVATDSAVQFPDEGLEAFAGDLGYKVANYYDRTVKVPEAVASYILDYVNEIPTLEDVNTLAQIDDIILEYIDCFPNCSTVSEAIEYMGTTAGHTEAYDRYNNAVTFIEEYIELGDDERNYNAVKMFETVVETLPDPAYADYSDEELKDKLEFLMALYTSFNLSHFSILGVESEDDFLELYDIMMGEEVKTGYSIGGFPYIPFNDFETNYTQGQLSMMYYDDYPARQESMATDVNNTKNFVTWVHDDVTSHVNSVSGIGRGWSPMMFNPSANDGSFESDTYYARMDAIITNMGFDNSQGATIRLHDELNVLDDWKMATVSTTYLGQNVDNWSELKGLDLSALSVSTAIDTDTEATETFDEQNVTRYGDGVIPNSFVMYVDFTEVENICMTIGFVLENKSDGSDVECYFNGGATDKNPVIYLLDENGEWVEEYLSATETDTSAASSLLNRDVAASICTITSAETNHLEGYKGFIRIPLTNFRITDLKNKVVEYTCEDYLCLDDELDNYTIKQAKVTFWDETGTNIDKEIHIDAMGFAYDPNCTTRTSTDVEAELNSDNGFTEEDGTIIKNMDRYFEVKTNDSTNVEQLISAIDPYVGKDQFIADCNVVLDAYSKLSEYQKSLEEIDTAYNELFYNKYYDLYMDYDNVILTDAWKPEYSTAAELETAIATLDSKMDITDKELPYPYDTATGEIDYSALGFDGDLTTDDVITMYEKGYDRLSNAEKLLVSEDNLTALENAYAAAKRIKLLESYLAEIDTFKESIVQIYGAGTVETDVKMVHYNNTALVTALENYEGMSIFAKNMLKDTTTEEFTKAQYANMYSAAEAIYDNSRVITTMSNITVSGGIIVFENRVDTCATNVSDNIASKTVLTDSLLNEIEYCLGQTESFKPRFAQIDEINVVYHKLLALLPVADVETTTTEALLTNADGGNTLTTDVDLSYVAARLNKTISVYVVSDYKWTQTSGTVYDFGYFTVNGVTGTDGSTIYTKIADYANGATAEINPIVSVDETTAKDVPLYAEYSGTIQVVAFDSSLIADDTDLSTLTPLATVEIPVEFQSTNGAEPLSYTVSIPAAVEVDWDTVDDVDVSYTVNATLGSNVLEVSVEDSGTETGKLLDSTGTHSIDFTDNNFESTEFTGDVTDGAPTNAPSITIAEAEWNEAPVGSYSTQLTYTVAVTS